MLVHVTDGASISPPDELFEFVDANGRTWQMTAAAGNAAGMKLLSSEPIAVASTRRAVGYTISGAPAACQVAAVTAEPVVPADALRQHARRTAP